MLKRAIAAIAVVGLCVAATTQIDSGSSRKKQADKWTPTTDTLPGDARSAGAVTLTSTRIATGLSKPLYVTHDGVNPDWIYVVEQRSGSTGRIKILDRQSGSLVSTFLSVSVQTSSEQGLLGLAFDPDYGQNGYFYINYSLSNRTYISRYQVSSNPQVADAGSAEVVLWISQPYSNHNGGWIGFGPDDGYLYIATGDGGNGGDPGNRAQDTTNQLLGKMLRLDVSSLPYSNPASNPFVGTTSDDEIWAYGLRNPWRCGFDRETGDLWIGDVGQNAYEEVTFQPGSSTGGENYGWRCYEGDHSYNTSGCAPSSSMVFPIWEYSQGGSPYRCSITGGNIYRGAAMPSMHGVYFFGDYCSNQIWSLRYNGTSVTEYTDRTSELSPDAGSIGAISGFGEDYYGEIYICDLNGEVFRIGPDSPTGACCFNGQCIPSTQTTCNNVGGDYQGDGVPCTSGLCDAEPCLADCNGDGQRDVNDLLAMLADYNSASDCDTNGDGIITVDDILYLLSWYGTPCD